MNTILDSSKTLFLDEINYSETFQIIVSEGFIIDTPQSIEIGSTLIEDVKPVEKTANSTQFRIELPIHSILSFQLIDESYSSLDKSEQTDTSGFLQIISNSPYMKYIDVNHGWYKDMKGEVKHYRVWTENEVIDVISTKEPLITKVN